MENLISTTIVSIQKACSVSGFKCAIASITALATVFFGQANAVIFVGIIILCCMDFFTAIVRDKKLGVAITSRKSVRTAMKIAVYGLLVSAGYITECIIRSQLFSIPIAGTISGFIAVTEMISILENVGKMGYVIPQKLLNLLEDYAKTK